MSSIETNSTFAAEMSRVKESKKTSGVFLPYPTKITMLPNNPSRVLWHISETGTYEVDLEDALVGMKQMAALLT